MQTLEERLRRAMESPPAPAPTPTKEQIDRALNALVSQIDVGVEKDYITGTQIVAKLSARATLALAEGFRGQLSDGSHCQVCWSLVDKDMLVRAAREQASRVIPP